MHVSNKTAVVARLRSAKEEVVPRCGLHSVAKYEVEGIEGFLYKISFWNQHAPVTIDADIVTVELSYDAPYLFVDGNGNIKRDRNGNVMCTRRLVLMCPKTKNGTYYIGYDPLVIAQKYVSEFMLPTAWDDGGVFIEKTETPF
jgi:hypothetical protein